MIGRIKRFINFRLIYETYLINEINGYFHMNIIQPLKKLALIGAMNKGIKISSAEFKDHISTSSKTAARVLKNLEDEGLIRRNIVSGGQIVCLTDKGTELLKKEYADYQFIFSGHSGHMELHGTVITGLGEGQYYMSKEGYRSQFREMFGFVPYPGTLNVRLDDSGSSLHQKLKDTHAMKIEGFTDRERTFGGGVCYPVVIENIQAAVIVPDRSHYPPDLLEIISPVRLRETLGLEDGDRVRIVANTLHCL